MNVNMPNDDWIAPLTRGMPDDIKWSLRYVSDNDFVLTGMWREQELFSRTEALDREAGRTTDGGFLIDPFDSGYRGLGLLYIRNALDFFAAELGFAGMDIYASAAVGGRVWAEAGFEFMPQKMQDTQYYNAFIDQMNRRFRAIASRLAPEEKEHLRDAIGDMRHDPRAIWRIADMDINLSKRMSPSHIAFYSAAIPGQHARDIRKRYAGALPLNAYMLNDSGWFGRFTADDAAQRARLDAAIARKTIARPSFEAKLAL